MINKLFSAPRPNAKVFAALGLLLGFALSARAAGPFTVNTISDSHAVSPATSPNDSGGFISLRSAIEAANVQSGATTINLPAGAYNLTLGELAVAPNGGETNTILGAGAGITFVTQTDPTNRVFNIDINSLGSTVVTLSGITIQGGHDGADKLGGAGVLAGSLTSTNKDALTLNNCVVQDNHCLANTTQEPGGGVQMAGGDLTLTACTFSNNTSGQSFGGAVFMLAQSVVSSLNVTNSTFVNNSMTNNSGAGPDGGGALLIETPTNSVHNIVGSTFAGNRVIGNSGKTYGGAIQINGGILNILNSTFVTNSVTASAGQGGLGGALYVDSGTVNLSFCRLAGNTATFGGGAIYNHGSNGAKTTATNNWWGCSGGPGATGCDVVGSDGGTMLFNPWIILTNTASPATIGLGQSTTLTASVLNNSSGQPLTPAQVSVLLGLPLIWNGAVHGTLSAAQTTIQPNGRATATFTNDGTCNTGSANVTLDSGTATATVLILCPDLTITKTNNVGGTTSVGNNWTWTIHVANAGSSPATFTNASTILLDNMPGSSIGYGAPTIANASGITGSLIPSVDGSANLMVTASGTVTLNPGASFDTLLTAIPSAPNTFSNPRSGGVCAVDPNNSVLESNKGNNSAADSVIVTCPAITGTVGGGGTICSGGSATVTVSLSGGAPPYTVTLNNGGGTMTGTGPLLFSVSPAATTTYQVGSGNDSLGCPVSNNGSATVTVSSVPNPTINVTPASVFANSGGNQASGPGGFAAYAWTISNGLITSPTNQPTITYVAGGSNRVTLGLTVFNGFGCSAADVAGVPVVTGFSIHTNVAFTDVLTATLTGIAFDGTNYWSCSGGNAAGVRLARYSSAGALVASYSPGLDFRSVFARADGTVLARAYNSGVIYQQTSPGVFASSGITLTGGTLDPQSSVVLNGDGTEYQAMSAGVVSRWGTNGTYLGSVALSGFGSVSGENVSPQSRGLAVSGNLWLSYNGNGILSVWDTNGNRIVQAALPGEGTSSFSAWGFSFCNGKVFLIDAIGSQWRGFDLYSGARVAVYGSPASPAWNTDVQNKILGTGLIPQVDAFLVNTGYPVPAPSDLRGYQAVLVYSDQGFNDNTNLGNALADYVDQGGGVALATFVFWNSQGLSIQGRLVTGGYLPFTTGTQTNETDLTLVKDLPLHPLLDGVASFDGGAASFHNSPIATAAGATLVAHWSDGQPLVAAKDIAPGRCPGLNFYPPSNDAAGGFWLPGTDGARLMADALLWSGRIPPTILAAPSDQVRPVGSTATFTVNAAGTSPLSYQWRLNGANIASATTSTLSFVVLSSSSGAYSVVVSNLYGATTSLGATLNPQLRFLTPAPSGGAFSLFLVDADGSPVVSNRAPRVRIYSATNVSLPFFNWTLLANPVVPSNGQLRVDGFNVTNPPQQFFRAVEAP
ncbi:MAG TPA: immunoglobulin domain-containing protein [Candidatus Binatia bacterium]|jgi:hypothetical protein|nr:immunoglobulin domain-containing protein [Candidatus Binatia bacterium]